MKPQKQCGWAWAGPDEMYRRCRKIEGHSGRHVDEHSWIIGDGERVAGGWRVEDEG